MAAGAGPITQIADLIIPEPYTNYIQQHTELKSNLVSSGALVRDEQLDVFVQNAMRVPGGYILQVPSLQDLARTPARVSTDTAHTPSFGGGTEPTPDKLGSTFELTARLSRNMSWSDADLARVLSGIQPLAAVQALGGKYWLDEQQRTFLAVWQGVFADNDAAPTGTDTHTAGDMTFDAKGGAFVQGVTNFNAKGFVKACGTLGDSMDKVELVVVHSVVYQTMLINNLIITVKDSELGDIPTFYGKRVIVDDSMPSPSTGVYESWLFQRGCTLWGNAVPDNATEIDRKAGAGNGGGQTVLYNRVCWAIHPRGYRFIGTPPASGGGPSNANTSNNLANAGSWSRVVSERKMIGACRYITREF